MIVMDCIKEYIKKMNPQEPIFTDDIYDYVKKHIPAVDRAKFNTNMQRYEKADDMLMRYRKGIYYKTVRTPFGNANIDLPLVVKRMYVTDGKEIFGYETGPSYMNKIGLTTQLPALTYIATDKVRYSMTEKELGIVFQKPVVDININNYRYLQFLDLIENKEGVAIEVDNSSEIFRRQIDRYALNFETLLSYARFYKSLKVYDGLAKLAKEVVK